MRNGADTGIAFVHCFLVRLQISNELLQGIGSKRLLCHEDDRRHVDQAHGLEVERMVRRIGVKLLDRRMRSGAEITSV